MRPAGVCGTTDPLTSRIWVRFSSVSPSFSLFYRSKKIGPTGILFFFFLFLYDILCLFRACVVSIPQGRAGVVSCVCVCVCLRNPTHRVFNFSIMDDKRGVWQMYPFVSPLRKRTKEQQHFVPVFAFCSVMALLRCPKPWH